MSDPVGIAIIDKPSGMTSHDVVARCRKVFGTRKVGHCGTLDPSATGVLVLGVGRATKLLNYLTGQNKTYEATIVFGTNTSTLDADGEAVATFDMSGLDEAAVRAAVDGLTGDIMQVPPMVSAIKIDGRRLHELAREGIEVDRPSRPVHIGRFEISVTDDPLVYRAIVDCSSGTYIRSLAQDLGTALGGGAHIGSLRRTRLGAFNIDEAHGIEDAVLLPAIEGLRHLPHFEVTTDVATAFKGGKVLDDAQTGYSGGSRIAVAVDADGAIVAVVERHGARSLRPAVPFL